MKTCNKIFIALCALAIAACGQPSAPTQSMQSDPKSQPDIFGTTSFALSSGQVRQSSSGQSQVPSEGEAEAFSLPLSSHQPVSSLNPNPLGLAFYPINDRECGVAVGYAKNYEGEIVIPASFNGFSVVRILDSGFWGSCASSVVIPSSVTFIGGCAFYECASLSSIKIPSSVESIPTSIFSDNVIIYCEAEAQPEGWNSSWNNAGGPVVWGYKGLSKSNGIHYALGEIGGNPYVMVVGCDSELTEGVIATDIDGSPVTSIGNYAFYYHPSLRTLEISSSIVSIGNYAFRGCSSMKSINIPSSVTFVGKWAFMSCTSLYIYCAAENCPSGWDPEWNLYGGHAIWAYQS